MKTPPVFATMLADASVRALLQSGGVLRVFEFGTAPQDIKRPYVVWQRVSGNPENYITCRPEIEEHLLQVDCYGDTMDSVKEVQAAVEYALETAAKVTSYGGESQEDDTKLWRSSFDVSWFVNR